MGVAGRMGRSAVVGAMWGVEATCRVPGATRSLDHTRHTAVVVMGQAAGKEYRQQAEQKSGVARKQRRTEAVHRFVPGAKIVKGESRDKGKPRFLIGLAEPHPIFARQR